MKPLKNKTFKIILFDIDYTLFNPQNYRQRIFDLLAYKLKHVDANILDSLENIYFKSKQNGIFIPVIFLQKLIKALGVSISPRSLFHLLWNKKIFADSLYKETKEVLNQLSKDKKLTIGILSQGYVPFQKKKIEAIKELLHKNHIHIFLNKEKGFKIISQKYKGSKLFYVDDILEFLKKAKEIDKNIITIWIKRGGFINKAKEIEDFKPDAIIDNLEEVIDIVNKN